MFAALLLAASLALPGAAPAHEGIHATISFAHASAHLSAEAKAALAGVAQALRDDAWLRARLVGRGDGKLDARRDRALGLRRADAARRYLIELGASAIRITAHGEPGQRDGPRAEVDISVAVPPTLLGMR